MPSKNVCRSVLELFLSINVLYYVVWTPVRGVAAFATVNGDPNKIPNTKGLTHISYIEQDHTAIRSSWCSHAWFNVACLKASIEGIYLSGRLVALVHSRLGFPGSLQDLPY